jgi:N-acetylglucosamine-6-sulfatase
MLAAIDDGVGAILKALTEAGQLDNTLIVVTSDHGYFYGEHGLSVERRLAYEESIRIPLVMRYPPVIAAGSIPENFALTIDFAPTFIEMASAATAPRYQGRSLVPLLEGTAPADWRRSFLIEYYSDTVFPRMNKMAYKAVRNDRWKYIHYTEQTAADELYDLQSDPYELKNLINDPSAAAPLAAMQRELRELLAEAVAN